jgi:hypothetical protein
MKQDFKTKEELMAFAQPLIDEKKYAIGAQPNADGTFTLQWVEQKHYTAIDGKTFPDEIWTTKEGEMIHIQDLSPEHARNVIRLILRSERERNAMLKEVLGKVFSEIQEGVDAEETQQFVTESVEHTLH